MTELIEESNRTLTTMIWTIEMTRSTGSTGTIGAGEDRNTIGTSRIRRPTEEQAVQIEIKITTTAEEVFGKVDKIALGGDIAKVIMTVTHFLYV